MQEALTARFGDGLTAGTDEADGDVRLGTYVSEATEILIGETNRVESLEVYLSLEKGQYAIRMVNGKLVILGYTDTLTQLAAEAFAETVNAAGDVLSLPDNYDVVVEPYAVAVEDSTEAEKPADITPVGELVAAEAEQWVVCEMEFTSSVTYDDPVYTVETDVIFYHAESGTTMTIPAFWDGGTTWRVRFAPTKVGEWSFYTVCTDTENQGLHHRAGTVSCRAYTGELDVYKHGFVKTEAGKNYFMYDDGTPFFYLADTHWTLPLEHLDDYFSEEEHARVGITQEEAEANGITSQFKYTMDYRAEQGYTVIQTQPLGYWTVPGQNGWFADDEGNIYTYGVNDLMLEKFQQYDRYFAYIAEKGLVHSNTQFGYPTALMTEYFGGKITDEQLEKLCRYWVARYSAYPVMWATTQEGDNDYYGDRGDCEATPETNPWKLVMQYIVQYDAYSHPTTCHQEHWDYTRVENSAFDKLEGHTWYAAQYNFSVLGAAPWNAMRDYWNNPGCKPVVNYEGRYDHFWTGTDGARAQGWLAYLNGQVGYGYGVQPIWSIFWSGDDSNNWTGSDELGEFKRNDNWLEGLQAEAGEQVTYIKDLLTEYDWWELAPCFDRSYFYEPGERFTCYSVSHIRNEVYIGYFYGNASLRAELGSFTSMKNGTYEVKLYNCRTGEVAEVYTVEVTDGTYKLPNRTDKNDLVIIAAYQGES